MKTIENLKSVQCCKSCGIDGFFCSHYDYDGDDDSYDVLEHVTCPCCGKMDHVNQNGISDNKYYFLDEEQIDKNKRKFDTDMRKLYKYCDTCNIIFDLGCIHYYSSDKRPKQYNCHFIKKWKDKTTQVVYEGMPQFNDANDWFDNVNNVVVLEWFCPHQGQRCKKPELFEGPKKCKISSN